MVPRLAQRKGDHRGFGYLDSPAVPACLARALRSGNGRAAGAACDYLESGGRCTSDIEVGAAATGSSDPRARLSDEQSCAPTLFF
jgi:hypothetical protein